MLFIFGWGHTSKKDFGETFLLRCPNCNNDVFFRYLKVRTWFTLFFIPIFPYDSRDYLICSACNYGRELDSSEIDEVKDVNKVTLKLLNKEIKIKEYKKELKNIKKFYYA